MAPDASFHLMTGLFKSLVQKRRLQLTAAACVLVLAVTACSGGPDPTPTFTRPEGFPPSFPYIFQGAFTVNGQPGPEALPIFARLGEALSPVAATLNGRYGSVIIGPVTDEQVGQEVTFYLGDPSGKSVRAEETYTFRIVSAPTNVNLDLTFDRLP